MNKNRLFSPYNQKGMASIMVTMLLMVVISLIVLGFAEVSRSEVRQSLDRQLSSQAFYAAESGVNDARQIIIQQEAAGQGITEKSDCATANDGSTAPYTLNPTIDQANQVTYPCLLVTSKLPTLTADVPLAGPSVKLPLDPATSSISTLHIHWSTLSSLPPPSSADFNKCSSSVPTGYFTPTSDWKCPIGVMRLEVVATDSLSGSSLANSQKVMFIYPVRSGVSSATEPFSASNGGVIRANCANVSSGCDVDLTGMNGGSTYMVKISSVYASGSVSLSAKNASNQSLDLTNAQIQIDATGRAQDVLRRIQVRLPMQDSVETPDYAIESGSSICKRYQYASWLPVENAADIVGQDQHNPTCTN